MKKFWPLLTAVVLVLPLASAQETGTTIASGLNGPMGVLAAPDGSIYVIDSGMGGDQTITADFPQAGGEVTAPFGNSAQIVQVAPDGTQTKVATLPSILVGQEATGGARLALLDGTLYATSGFWIETAGSDAPELMATVVKVTEGEVTQVADTWAFENSNNPDGTIRESHPFGLIAGADGSLWVADAGANALLKVNRESGEISVAAVFEGIPGPLPNPARGNAMASDPVPTGVVAGEDGNLYVSLLPGFPFVPGSAKVVRVTPDGEISDHATGLTMLTDLRMGPDGNLYAVQFAEWSEQGPTPNSGAVVRISEGEGSEVVMSGLSFPTSLDFADNGDAYVTLNGVGAPGSGEVVRFEGVTEMASGQ